jgi:hypothetical protein
VVKDARKNMKVHMQKSFPKTGTLKTAHQFHSILAIRDWKSPVPPQRQTPLLRAICTDIMSPLQ